ncbi:hypothetical protein [Cronobacter malonaticus]|uniref:DUF7739 domain-containing protein n=1 Tax=Cronobacter malonaticus TaxID=413503 RepID=UPI001D3EB809|nr:hypothetical protein [Cronobacter malonaticus]EGT4415631.1 hypothetical protein [Cronobacter malonaticus]ELY6326595.1 hypothetical protein [Cronobacter malonaticus]ELY6418713.1 hypothetical protein [Cronobacter malonaticus]EMD9400744.1 hypothetical protein [Cronobacter malonaticus]
MSVELVDKRRPCERIAGLGMANGTWFAVLDIPGMEKLVNQRHTNDPLDVTPAKAKKMAALVEAWMPPDEWSGNEPEKMKAYIVEFLRDCNGFRSY